MTKVTISEAARLAGISRQHFYRAFINTGKISIIKHNDKSAIEISELLRVFPDAKITTNQSDTLLQVAASPNEQVTQSKDDLITLLKSQLAEAKEREEWFKSQLERTTHLLENKTTEKKRKKFLGVF